MKSLPGELGKKPNDHLVLLDASNVGHKLAGTGSHRSACRVTGTPVTLAQAIAYGQAWCGSARCWTLRGRGSR